MSWVIYFPRLPFLRKKTTKWKLLMSMYAFSTFNLKGKADIVEKLLA
jgi:hypothetical protein